MLQKINKNKKCKIKQNMILWKYLNKIHTLVYTHCWKEEEEKKIPCDLSSPKNISSFFLLALLGGIYKGSKQNDDSINNVTQVWWKSVFSFS